MLPSKVPEGLATACLLLPATAFPRCPTRFQQQYDATKHLEEQYGGHPPDPRALSKSRASHTHPSAWLDGLLHKPTTWVPGFRSKPSTSSVHSLPQPQLQPQLQTSAPGSYAHTPSFGPSPGSLGGAATPPPQP